ncbi:MAG: PQQ-dependent sugar dehydrogenase, partial [Pseudomonadota bacterium]
MILAHAVGHAGAPPADLTLNSLNIGVSTPLALRHAGDGSGRLFIVEREGRIQIYREGTGLASSPFLDITSDVDTFFEGGLLGLAFHPDFASNGFFYVNYTRDGSGPNPLESVIERFSVSPSDP